ncbi:ribulose-phosphate 3-epimerase [Clostridium sp. CAG:1000]|jgi:ribulose-phosphate 3-epimerase|nr:ribulose-phosphate 3-epimerase [Clostridium sp. CAG:1000]
MKVSVSVLSNEIKPQDIVKKLDLSKPDYIHIDIMDGKFVSNKTWTTSEVKKFTSYSTLPLEVHLMVNNPSKYIEDYALMNTSIIIFHYEAVKDINEMINKVKLYGLKVGIAINPETNINVLIPYLNMIDEVLIMSVHPGKSGQSFIEESLEKISVLKNIILEGNYKTIISVDGGINNETGLLCKDAGVDELVSASYIHKDIINNIKTLKNI